MIGKEDDPRNQTQTLVVGQVEGKEGNCTQAAIATFMGLPLSEVPDFNNTTTGAGPFWQAIEDWFRDRGYQFEHHGALHRWSGMYLAGGNSPRGVEHMVVFKDGELYWDPHPSRAGIDPVNNTWIIRPLDPITHKA